ncbi:MAG TPA: hypothetical protein RMH85_07415 [Polyangiaceae bacterium LLY-WYZ-15_(1-7)]|nr:hypothetical protein [Myxococcales bacterium]MAT28370.1 hypothetical protein [Sandaracinus sp.]HJK91324.1 hypothetical protein [Polyangiaceae bacterium LLY-WYZ-15_(1-7)]HJL04067.1 hypothetical protein [Polyangiaceae bacterium LLY-WYZ-15_(1-7)]HJL08308.1 hypothetical protein [Polyangiaceae bacterium LLY-WYZ-15_(1-7)]
MSHAAKPFSYVLVLIHAVLIGWGVLGLVEYAYPAASLGLQNASFPPALQFLHFASVLVTGAVFLGGYLTRWRSTPFATVTMYAVLATICFIETVDFGAFGGGWTRFIPMTLEYVTYLGISAFLLRSSTMRRRFSRGA